MRFLKSLVDNNSIEKKYLSKTFLADLAELEQELLDEGKFKDYSVKGLKLTVKALVKSFDVITEKLAEIIEKSSAETGFKKIDAMKTSQKRMDALNKKASFYQENYVRTIWRMEKEVEDIDKKMKSIGEHTDMKFTELLEGTQDDYRTKT